MSSSGTLRRVVLVRTDVSEEYITSFIRVERIRELGATRRHIAEEGFLHSDRYGHLRSYTVGLGPTMTPPPDQKKLLSRCHHNIDG
jgi:hypothetical protein